MYIRFSWFWKLLSTLYQAVFISVRYLDFSKIYMYWKTVSYSNSFQCEYFNINEHVATLMNKLYKMPDVRLPNSCRKYGLTIGAWMCLLYSAPYWIKIKICPFYTLVYTSILIIRISCYAFYIYFSVNVLRATVNVLRVGVSITF